MRLREPDVPNYYFEGLKVLAKKFPEGLITGTLPASCRPTPPPTRRSAGKSSARTTPALSVPPTPGGLVDGSRHVEYFTPERILLSTVIVFDCQELVFSFSVEEYYFCCCCCLNSFFTSYFFIVINNISIIIAAGAVMVFSLPGWLVSFRVFLSGLLEKCVMKGEVEGEGGGGTSCRNQWKNCTLFKYPAVDQLLVYLYFSSIICDFPRYKHI